MAETNIEGVVGLELLRVDIGHAGYGLPWNINGAAFIEAIDDASTAHNDALFNDNNNPPRAIVSGDGVGIANSDVIVIKAINVAMNDTAQRWSYITSGSDPKPWGTDDLVGGIDRVVVINPKASETSLRELVVSGGAFSTTYSSPFNLNFSPPGALETYIIYGVDTTALRMPFNRTDYSVSTTTVPLRCATGTGVLEKATINHATGGFNIPPMQILDCVADMQVAFGVDTTNPTDGTVDCYTNDLASGVLPAVDAENVRERVKEVRVYILAHEGQFDNFFNFNIAALNAAVNPPIGCGTCFRVGEGNPSNCTGLEPILGQDFDLSAITDWQNFRWKVYTLVVRSENLE